MTDKEPEKENESPPKRAGSSLVSRRSNYFFRSALA